MNIPGSFKEGLEELHEQASAATGLDDFGDNSYLHALEILLSAYDSTARFSDAGRIQTWAMLVNCLRGRLYAVSNNKIAAKSRERIEKPLFIVGLPRTGTTVLHRLLCSFPENQGLEYLLGSFPQPRPPRETWSTQPRFCETRDNLAMLHQLAPDMKHIHEMHPDLLLVSCHSLHFVRQVKPTRRMKSHHFAGGGIGN